MNALSIAAQLGLAPQPAIPDGWKPIETAPKDGTAVLVFPATWNGRTASIAKWEDDRYAKKPRPYWSRDDAWGRVLTSRENPPTHWMPLPAAPEPSK